MGVSADPKHRRHHHHHQEARVRDADGASSIEAKCLYGDVLESVVERVPAADLAATARVSPEWLRAVRAVLRRRPRRLPWLVVHLQGLGGRGARCAAAYDPCSGAWLSVPVPSHATPSHVRLLRGGGARGDRVCALSLSGLAVAADPFGTTMAAGCIAPALWRVDPVLAAVGDRVVALGGACALALLGGTDAAAVDVHEPGGDKWTACDPVPDALSDSAAATWLSVAATDKRVYLVERTNGWASWFDPANRRWGPTHRLGPDPALTTWGVAPGRVGAEERLVLFGAKRADKEAEFCMVVVQAWEVDGDTLEPTTPSASGDAMPPELSERLFPRGDTDDRSLSIGVCGNAAGGYVYNAAAPANGAVLYELWEEEGKKATAGGVARWDWVPCAPAVEAQPLGRALLACSPVGLDELALAVGARGPR